MRAVAAFLEKEWGATVTDVSRRNLGWDLTADVPEDGEWYVEVKGVSGSRPTVLLTADEWGTASVDDAWLLAVVTEALSRDPYVRVFEGRQMLRCAQPFVWRADVADEEAWEA